MPRVPARFFTASSNRLGMRMFNCAPFFSNSKCVAFPCDKSYSERSAVSTKRSAALSLLRSGSFFFIVVNLLLVHEPRTDRTDIFLSVTLPQGEHQEHIPPLPRLPDSLQALLAGGMRRIGKNSKRPPE